MPGWIWRLTAVLSAVVLAVVGFGVYRIVSDRTSPVSVDEAVDRYRDSQAGTTPDPTTTAVEVRSLPAAGVYVYATDGEEHVSALGGSTHRYPAETTITVSPVDCGQRQRWSPLDERWDEQELCQTDDGLVRRGLRIHHQFFSMSDEEDFSCPGGYLLVPARPVVGDTWSTDCVAEMVHNTGTGEVIGFETRVVGTEEVETVHVRLVEDGTGSSVSHGRDDYWLRVGDGLLIARESSVTSTTDSVIGAVDYSERYTLTLTSLVPRT